MSVARLDPFISTRSPLFEGIDPEAIDLEQKEAAIAHFEKYENLDRARRILFCPPLEGMNRDFGSVSPLPCGRSLHCPRCAQRRARRLAKRFVETALTFTAPIAMLCTCPSRSRFDLELSLDRMNVAHATLRRRRWFSSVVRAGVLALETPPTRDGARWALHGHGVLDATAEADGAAWRERLSAEWRSLVETPGAVFELEPLRSPGALAGYAMKLRNAKSWAPGVRELDSERRAQVAKALRHRRLLVTWGGRQCRG